MTASSDPRRDPRREQEPDERPVLPDRTQDERDVGWGDERDPDARDEAWYRRERPPHHE